MSEGEFVTVHVRVLDRHLGRSPRKAAGDGSTPAPVPEPKVKDHELGLLHLRARVGLALEPISHPLLTTRWAKGHGTLDLGWKFVAEQEAGGIVGKERSESELLIAPAALLY